MTHAPRGPQPPSFPPPAREPVFNVPTVVAGLIGVLLLIHGLRDLIPGLGDFEWTYRLAFVPGRLAWWLQPDSFMPDLINSVRAQSPEKAAVYLTLGRVIEANNTLAPWSFFTHAFLHASWTHVILNSVWLLAFGSPLASRFGVLRFLVFFLVCAVGGAFAHFLSGPLDVIPMIGASGAISGCMGASMRFAFNAHGGLFGGPASVHLAHADSLRETMRNRRSMLFAGAWLATNIAFGLLAGPLGFQDANVAWQAHIGGFVTGLLLFGLFDPYYDVSSSSDRRR